MMECENAWNAQGGDEQAVEVVGVAGKKKAFVHI